MLTQMALRLNLVTDRFKQEKYSVDDSLKNSDSEQGQTNSVMNS